MMKQIPYGLTDFGRIQKENYYYVDKTMFIEKIEMQPSYLFLIRPDASGNINEVEESFRMHCCGKLSDFVYRYEHLLGKNIWKVLDEKTKEEPGAFLSAINTYATRKGDIKIYLLID